MSRLKFEEEFAKKLKDREIKPSTESWAKLSKQLDQKGKRRKPIFWIGIAASLTAAILVLNFYNAEENAQNVEIVGNPSEETEVRKVQPGPETQVALEETPAPVKVNSSKNDIKETTVVERAAPMKIIPTPMRIEKIKELEIISTSLASKAAIDKEIKEIITEINLREAKKQTVSDAEINALLAEAAAEISMESNNSFTGNYKAEDLLLEVEMELEQSFRQKIFEVLKENLHELRTAIVNKGF